MLERKGYAFATTADSGRVVQRDSGQESPFNVARLWFFHKVEDTWKVTAQIAGYSETASIETEGGSDHAAIEATLRDEAEAMGSRDLNAVAAFYDEHLMGIDGRYVTTPAAWKITFSGKEGSDTWLAKRFQYGSYSVRREVLHAVTDASEKQAAAIR